MTNTLGRAPHPTVVQLLVLSRTINASSAIMAAMTLIAQSAGVSSQAQQIDPFPIQDARSVDKLIPSPSFQDDGQSSWENSENGDQSRGDHQSREEADEADDDAPESYGPDNSEPRGTLFQWSYGTSFSGGPDLNEPLVTDRPDFTEATSTVGLGVAQIEMGYTFSSDDDGATATRSHSAPESLLRYGILQDWLELRVAWNYAFQRFDGVDTSGGEDMYLGFKIGLTPQEGIFPEMALIPQMTVPTGAAAFTADEVLPGLNWVYGWEVNDFLSTAASTQFNRAVDDGSGQAYTEWAQSWTIGYSLADKIGAYTEWFAFFPHSADTAKPEHYLDGGFTYLINQDIQWDIRAGIGLNEAAQDYFVGTGLSIRFR